VRSHVDGEPEALDGHQTAVNAAYALKHGHELVATYTDAGVSGLTLARRQGLQALLGHIVGGAPDFRVVLVYDVSRWGRFLGPDESAQEQLTREMRAKMGK